jgi:hypothetical protein
VRAKVLETVKKIEWGIRRSTLRVAPIGLTFSLQPLLRPNLLV